MNKSIIDIFNDKTLINRIQDKLPRLFYMAELESSRAGKIGMEVGSLREKILIAMLIYKFGESNVETGFITESEVDVRVFGKPLSIKTFTGKNISSVKLIWTVDPEKAIEFSKSYKPPCDMLLVQINWNSEGGLYYLPKEIQLKIMKKIKRNKYIKLPKRGTNPRGIEISKEALVLLTKDEKCKKISIEWQKEKIEFNPYKRWLELWSED